MNFISPANVGRNNGSFEISQNFCQPKPERNLWETLRHGWRGGKYQEPYCTERRIQELEDSTPLEGYCAQAWRSNIQAESEAERGILVNRPESITAFVNETCDIAPRNSIFFRKKGHTEGPFFPLPEASEGTIPRY